MAYDSLAQIEALRYNPLLALIALQPAMQGRSDHCLSSRRLVADVVYADSTDRVSAWCRAEGKLS